jgi:hypothetical protein
MATAKKRRKYADKALRKVAITRDDDKSIDEDRLYIESRTIQWGPPIGQPNPTPELTMTLMAGSSVDLALKLGTADDGYKSLSWTATDDDYVKYEGKFSGKSMRIAVTRIDLVFSREGEQDEGPRSYQIGYRVNQFGDIGCQNGPSVRVISLAPLDSSGAVIGPKFNVGFGFIGNKPGDSGPQRLVSKSPSPKEVMLQTTTVWAKMPTNLAAYTFYG